MLQTSTKYGLKALLWLAQDSENSEFVRVRDLSKEIKVPGPYLSKVIKQLAESGILETRRGAFGGVRLRDSSQSLYSACVALQDPICMSACFLSNQACQVKSPCPFHEKWGHIRKHLIDFLQSTTFAEYSQHEKN